ncbi:GNAT family N-acetyltransferase [Pararhizobium sp.]|uniref:GNAT family N-acetyltransferase n=1 Tax=Pararhizobium sp. TaxID=1977563 RepID=UPI003D0E8AF4
MSRPTRTLMLPVLVINFADRRTALPRLLSAEIGVGGRMYEIRQARLGDWPLIKPFINVCYGASAHYKQESRWRWQFVDNPYAKEAGGLVPVWIAVHDGQVVGQIALQAGRMWIDGSAYPADWVVDVMVHPDHRGGGLGHKIHDAIRASGRTLVTLTMADATRRISERAGCITLGPVYQFARIHRLSAKTVSSLIDTRAAHRPLLRMVGGLLGGSMLGPAVAAIGTKAFRSYNALRKPLSGVAEIWDVERVAPEIADEGFTRAMSKIPALFDRGSEFCQWRFDNAPDLQYQSVHCDHGRKTRGFAIWRMPEPSELPFGTLVDIVADPDDVEAISAMSAHAVRAMEPDCEAIVAGASHPSHIAALKALGFVTVKVHRPTVVTNDPQAAAAVARYKDRWHFSKADHDWDQVHPPGS